MKTYLHNCGRLEIRQTSNIGWGVFATDEIKKGEILEECPFVLFPRYHNNAGSIHQSLKNCGILHDKEVFYENLRSNLGFLEPEKYFFKWYPKNQLEGEISFYLVLPLGNSCIYNSSNINNNASWHIEDRIFIFKADKDIEKDSEITTFYGYILDEQGITYDCDSIFNLGINKHGLVITIEAIRFGLISSYNKAQNEPNIIKLSNLLNSSLGILDILELKGNNGVFDCKNSNIQLSSIYSFLQKQSSLYLKVKYIEKETNEEKTQEVLLRKN